jgi:hypothetical protein
MSVRLRSVLDAWQIRGELRVDITVDVAISQVISPLSALQWAYLNGNSSKADIAQAAAIARHHHDAITGMLTTTGEEGK